jgi:O-antigen biosynthesis protein
MVEPGAWTQPYSRTSARELKAMRRVVRRLSSRPRVSLLMAVQDHDEAWIRATIDSLRRQVYPAWELCICDNGSSRPHVGISLSALRRNRRLRVRTLSEPAPIAEGLATALTAATGDLCAIVGCGDTLAPDALFRVVETIVATGADIVYTDEDSIDEVGQLGDPVLKPHWSPDLLLSSNYIGRLCVVRRSLVEVVGGFASSLHEGGEHDLLLRISERARGTHHLSGFLYHRRTLPEEPGETAAAAATRAVWAALDRRGEEGTVRLAGDGSLRVARRSSKLSTVAAIVRLGPSAHRAPVVRSLANHVDETVVVGGRAGALRGIEQIAGPSPAQAANLAADRATSDYLLFLDGEGQPSKRSWEASLSTLLAHAERRGVGAIGCRLLYRDGRLRQSGQLIDLDALSQRPSERLPATVEGRPTGEDRPFNPWIVRADCMLVRRSHFKDAGGFDAAHLPESLHDIDLALRLTGLGLLNVYTPDLTFVCSFARESPPADEIAYLWQRWWERLSSILSYHHPVARLALRDSGAMADAAIAAASAA